MTAKALLFDVGDVMMESNWVVLDALEQRVGRRIVGRGAIDPAGDPAWQRYVHGEINANEYWNALAHNAGYPDRITLWRAMSDELGGGVFAPDALQLIDEAKAGGIKVGVLSNDLYRASTREWVASRPEFDGLDALVDCTEFGERKPAPGPYLKAASDLALDPGDIVFLDDTPMCIEGARDVGMIGVHVDPLARHHAFERARRLVGLLPPIDAEVQLTRLLHGDATGLLHPDAVIHVNGARVAAGLVEAIQWLSRRGALSPLVVRAVSGDTIVAEVGRAALLATTRHGLLIECQFFGEGLS